MDEEAIDDEDGEEMGEEEEEEDQFEAQNNKGNSANDLKLKRKRQFYLEE